MADTASKTPERNGRITRQFVHVAIYEHPHGEDVRVFHDKGDAWDWRTRLAQEWWSKEVDDESPSRDVIGPEYFDRMGDKDRAEYFSVLECEFEGSDPKAEHFEELLTQLSLVAQPMGLSATDFQRWLPHAQAAVRKAQAILADARNPDNEGGGVMTDEPDRGTMTSDAFDDLIDDATHAVNNLIPDHLLAVLSDDALTLVLADYIERKD